MDRDPSSVKGAVVNLPRPARRVRSARSRCSLDDEVREVIRRPSLTRYIIFHMQATIIVGFCAFIPRSTTGKNPKSPTI
ncbi:hypothetical protein PsorP6_003598 [Peronosclerospora sorghi]|uniref:Uncharacterized protein n=1 Tax=Peronosclerospora sorghi TaxID=230839 RepID=A0ACC0VK26_9STRA|nr:hypothetical protein PsorP6_003598 [Peronosclerospora sorghi]